jgi:putative ABC transport system substrate-binding protein
MMRRRQFIGLLGGAMAANGTLWRNLAHAQTATPVVGILSSGPLDGYTSLLAAFRQGLGETGYVEGRNVVIEARGAAGQFNRTTQLAHELIQRQAAVLVATGNGSARAAQAATKTIPLVFLSQGDPVKFGLVENLSRPGGNATGVAVLASDLLAKRLDLVRQLARAASPIAVIINPKAAEAEPQVKEVEEAARNVGQRIVILNASDADEIHAAFEKIKDMGAGALIVSTDAYLFGQRDRISALAIRHALPAMYDRREFAVGGGLMTYGTHYADAYRRMGGYTGKVLKGAKPADLPVEQAARFELVINLKTAKIIGLNLPPALLALADEVIE